MKKITSLLAIATLAISLSGCAPQSQQQATNAMFDSLPRQCTAISDGTEAKSIDVTGSTGTPAVSFKAGLVSKAPQVHVLKVGDGPTFTGNQLATFEIEALDGPSAKPFPDSTGLVTKFDGTNPITTLLANGQDSQVSLCNALTGVRVGSRIAAVFPLKPATSGGKETSAVLVVDLLNVFLPHAAGQAQPAVSGIPVAARVASGEPGLTFPSNQSAPKDYQEYVSVKGAGEVVQKGDNVKVHYKLYDWTTNPVKVEASWGSDPIDVKVGTGTIEGFAKAIEGKTVGSQVVAVIPPSLGYKDEAKGTLAPNSTLVFVIDILGKY